MRAIGPKPGKKPKNVGEVLSPYSRRFDCRTHSPPLNCVRTQKPALPSTFAIPTRGTMFQLPCAMRGSSMLVFQSTLVWKFFAYTRETVSVESLGSGYTVWKNVG